MCLPPTEAVLFPSPNEPHPPSITSRSSLRVLSDRFATAPSPWRCSRRAAFWSAETLTFHLLCHAQQSIRVTRSPTGRARARSQQKRPTPTSSNGLPTFQLEVSHGEKKAPSCNGTGHFKDHGRERVLMCIPTSGCVCDGPFFPSCLSLYFYFALLYDNQDHSRKTHLSVVESHDFSRERHSDCPPHFPIFLQVDHSGTYKQSSQGTIVAPSNDDSCLDNSKTAAIVTQTVFMSSGGRVGTGLDDKSLLILTVVFAVAFFTAAAGVVYLFSKLRQTRRTRGGQGSRFALTNEDFDSMHSGESLHEGPEYGTGYMAASSAARRQNSRAARSSLGGSTIAPTRDSTYGSNDKAVKEVESRRMSRISESASMLAPAESYDALTSNLDTEKGTRSPVSPRSE